MHASAAGQRNRTIKEATVKRYHYDSQEQLRVQHGARTNGAPCFTLDLFIDAYNHARRLKTLKGLTPTQFIWKEWQARPELFYEEPCHLTVGPYKLAKCIFGATRAQSGKVRLNGQEVAFHGPLQAIQAGLIYLPEERKQEGIFPLLSIAENTALPSLDRFPGFLRLKNWEMLAEVCRLAVQLMAKFNALDDPISSLSGGNQQKFILARWLMRMREC